MDFPTVDLPALPPLLAAPAPGWVETTDVIVVGSGVAGLTAALHLREAGLHVTVVTKVNIDDGSTRWAQGGIAAVLDPADTPAAHARDTEIAGVGLCDPAAVRALVEEGPTRLRELMRIGAEFDRHPDGSLMLTREGGHRADRIVHAGGDATGAEVQRALHAAVQRDPWIRLVEHALVLDLLRAPGDGPDGLGPACGITLHVLGEGSEDGVGALLARAVVLATGGMGQVFAATTNPAVSTGDGVALAMRAGAAVTDIEFVQFHPTVMWRGADSRGQQPLVSEAVRGEGAILYDAAGRRVMTGMHPLEDLAPRDVVAAAISRRMAEAPGGVDDHVYLDATAIGERFYERFPTITAACRDLGLDPARDRIPVAPAAHFACGGIRAGLDGVTSLCGLYAVGEVASTGVHGANRLASNSLTESIVAGTRVGRDLAWELPDRVAIDVDGTRPLDHALLDPSRVREVRAVMSRHVGVVRDALSLASAAGALGAIGRDMRGASSTRPAGEAIEFDGDAPAAAAVEPSRPSWEGTNILTVATAVVAAAAARSESRGCHRRSDFPDPLEEWRRHLDVTLDAAGTVVADDRAAP